MKYYIIAGEPSGDLHGASIIKAIKQLDNDASFLFWGGDHMLDIDPNIITHIRETSIMGFVEVIKNLPKIKSFFKKAKHTIQSFQPDVVVLIDYPGFNLRMAKWAKRKGFRTIYYISPQLWAWKKGRIKTIKNYVDEMIVILPFEVDFYHKYGVTAHYVGHPLLPPVDAYLENNASRYDDDKKKIIAILPGSRKQEIRNLLPSMIRGASHYSEEFRLCVAMAPNTSKSFYVDLIVEKNCEIEFIADDTYGLLSRAHLAIVTSGTATLETALFGVPQVVCYKTSTVNYEIGKRLVELEFISLVNLIGGKRIVPELIQHEVNEANIINALDEVKMNSLAIQLEYKKLKSLLKEDEAPSNKAAKIIVKLASEE